jgi:uncharacterized protein (TIGR02246 family)
MPARTPEEAHELFVKYFNAGDLELILSLYEPNATLVSYPGVPVQGRDGIREAIKGFLSLKGHMELHVDRVFQTDDIGLLFSTWHIRGTDPEDGSPRVSSGQTSDVVRKQPDGSWLFVIDNPEGAACTR